MRGHAERARTRAGSQSARFRRLLIVSDGRNPTIDYYLTPRIGKSEGLRVEFLRLEDEIPDCLRDYLTVFVRYIDKKWLRKLDSDWNLQARLIIDDDFGALSADFTQAKIYRAKMRHSDRAATFAVNRLDVRPWVSTQVLVQRWIHADPVLMTPAPAYGDLDRAPSLPPDITVGFHATGSHAAELNWLTPVFTTLAAQCPDLHFDIVTGAQPAELLLKTPRVLVRRQMSWSDYRRFSRMRGLQILLAPHVESTANRARAPVKRFDATRLGAALLVSDGALFAVSPTERAMGMDLPLDQKCWIDAVRHLARDPERRGRLADLNRQKVASMDEGAVGWFRRDEESSDVWLAP